MRFPALVAASVTFFLWNFVLAPVMYFFFMKTAEKKKNFLWWNLQFHMQQIHTLNYPIAVLNCALSPSARALVFPDLWAALFVGVCYSVNYLLILDRLGVHLYPIFSPRSKGCVPAWGSVFLIYYFTYKFWNAAIGTGRLGVLADTPGVWREATGEGLGAIYALVTRGELAL
ncbi:hypothetical protein TeGR_g6678 [Tetraparma gracilis]|uniref:Uncharacterized protein n=1 Tax=Tetraparma gracilis TaxID=2962635 RepID=A0ABQ6N2T4_9STRA|nr:hypothetical protein TeGR_g6678 [Tetraparma gracilis]